MRGGAKGGRDKPKEVPKEASAGWRGGGEDRKRRKETKGNREKEGGTCGREREELKGEGDVEAQRGSVEGAPKN